MKLAARAARRQREKQLIVGIQTHKLGRTRYKEPSLDLKLSSEQVNCLRELAVELLLLPFIMSRGSSYVDIVIVDIFAIIQW